MKKNKYYFTIRVFAFASLLVYFMGCYHFSFVNQPFTAELDSSFTTEISCVIDRGTGGGFYTPYFGILVPNGWTVNDSIEYSFDTVSAWFLYSDMLTQQMDSISPAPPEYIWWVFEGSEQIQALCDIPFLFNPVINTDDQSGMFSLDYMLGDNSQGLNYERSNGHLITVDLPDNITVINSNDNGQGSLREAINEIDFYGTIDFDLDEGDTIFLEEEINIYKDIRISGTENNLITISGQFENRVIFIGENRNVVLANLQIVNGKADYGGGILCSQNSNTALVNVTVTNNLADNKGGGIAIYNEAVVEFDDINKCNIFLNNALWGNDIYSSNTTYITSIITDTFTVLHPSEYHIYPFESFDYQILNEKIEQVDGVLFVSENGKNTNSGLNEDEPLKTIDFAFSKIRADSLHQNTIRLLNGTYSQSSNEEGFPLIIPNFVNISGESPNGVLLDAEGQSCVIYFDQNSSNNISNLTIMNGYNENQGGGIYCNASNPVLHNLLVSYNKAYEGGGIRFYNSNPVLEEVTVSYNNAEWGGGISVENSSLTFDSTHRCNIYLNKAINGSDIHTHSAIDVIVDTFSVLHPNAYHADPVDLVTYDIKNGKLQQFDHDLFVSPTGDDNNIGITEDSPLKTIEYACSKIWVDSTHKNIIQLLEGTYGPSANGEVMPINLHGNFILKGISASETILNAEDSSGVLFIDDEGVIISDMTITGGNSIYGGGICCDNGAEVKMQNLIISGNYADHGGGICFGDFLGYVNATLQNVLISDNSALDRGGAINGSSLSLTLQNVTIANNSGERGGGIHIANGSSVFLENSIMSDNIGSDIFFLSFNGANSATISWSNVNGSISTNGNGNVNWSTGSIQENPFFVGQGNHPYQLNDNSPCIDAGTPDTTSLNLPEYDLAGELRITNNRVDMGAYEWNTFVGDEELLVTSTKLKTQSYPNPFTSSTTIEYELTHPETIRINFYNQFGKQVDVIEERQLRGLNKIVWTPENLADGVYYFRIAIGGLEEREQVTSEKLIKLN